MKIKKDAAYYDRMRESDFGQLCFNGKLPNDTIDSPQPQKRGSGRPRAFEETATLSLRLPPSDIRKIKALASVRGITASQFVHDLVSQVYLQDYWK